MDLFCVIGCGYVGTSAALHLKYQGLHITGTTKSRSKLISLSDTVAEPLIVNLADPDTRFDFLEKQNGLLISVAPSRDGDSYDEVFSSGIKTLASALQRRQSTHPLHITYISTAGVYGDHQGSPVDEETDLDREHAINALLAQAEETLMGIERPDTTICILRLGGIYGPGRDMAGAIKSAAGESVKKNGNHVCSWTNIVDVAEGIAFAYDRKLEGIFNLVDDMQLTRRELSNVLCDADGLPPVLWMNHDLPGQRISNARVSNQKIKSAGFRFKSPSMLDPLQV